MKRFALVTAQGTAAHETVLDEAEYTPEMRARIEVQFCNGGADDPIAGTWRDVSDNDALDRNECRCLYCGAKLFDGAECHKPACANERVQARIRMSEEIEPEILQAGGNMGGDCGPDGVPVVEGKFYVVLEGSAIAGPFDTHLAAAHWIAWPRYGCPRCGSERIIENNTVRADYPVSTWDINGTPEDYEESDICWDTVEAEDGDFRYRCAECGPIATFAEPVAVGFPRKFAEQ